MDDVRQVRRDLEAVKTGMLSTGVRVSDRAMAKLRESNSGPLSIHEYPTTGGLTLELPEQVYVNAPFDESYCDGAKVELDWDDDFVLLEAGGIRVEVARVLPLPDYLDRVDSQGRQVTEVMMSHADRARVSPLAGCAYDCSFCDFHDQPYILHDAARLIESIDVALDDEALPVRHLLISGGSPRRRQYDDFVRVVGDVIEAAVTRGLPTDVMMSPMLDDGASLDEFVRRGATGFSINIELFSPGPALQHLGRKYRVTRDHFDPYLSRAVDMLGNDGAVRSLIIPGIEPDDAILEGVDWLASRGCWPVLSPFRPAAGTPLEDQPPPSADRLGNLLTEARKIAQAHGVGLGPTCVECQHNTLTFPWDVAPQTAGSEV